MRSLGFIAAAAAVLLLAGCASGGSNASSTGNGLYDPAKLVSSTAAGTKAVDNVTWGIKAGEPSSLDPVRTGSDSQYQIMANMCESLLAVKSDFSIGSGLATAADWNSSGDFVITLRSGVKFWDGTALTADDVVYSLKRSADPKSGSIATAAFERVKSIQATGPLQVTVKFSQRDSQFRNSIAGPAGVIFEKAYTVREGSAMGTPKAGPMCTGPFKFSSWKAGTNIVLKANSSYWGGAPLVHTLTFVFVDSDATLTNALLAGQIDGAFDVPVSSVKQLNASKAGTVYIGQSNATASFGPVASSGPAADWRVRQALNLVIDKTAYVRSVLGGYGAVGKTFTPPFMWNGLTDAATYRAGYAALASSDVDVAKAKKLIAEAKPSKKTLTIAVPAGDQQTLQSATIVQAAGKTLGLTISIKQMQASQFADMFYNADERKGIDFLATTGYLDTPGAYAYASFFALPGGLFNWTNYSDPKVTALLNAGRGASSEAEAAKDFVAAQAIFAPKQLQVTLGIQYTRVFLSSKLTGITTSLSYIVSPWAAKLGGK